jgi:hypothetical protein
MTTTTHTAAIKELLEEKNGDISYKDALPILRKRKVKDAQGRALALSKSMSTELRTCRKVAEELGESVDDFDQQKVFDAAGLSEDDRKAVGKELATRKLYAAQANGFNVIKWTWGKSKTSGSKKPAAKKKGVKKTAKTKKPASKPDDALPAHISTNGQSSRVNGVHASREMSLEAALAVVREHGGMNAMKQKMAEMSSALAVVDKMVTSVA